MGDREALPENDHLVLLIHGINTRARWTNDIKTSLRAAGFNVQATSYGRFGIPRFLLPFDFLRRSAVERVSREVTSAISNYRPAKLSVISHSFGTFVVARILEDHPEFRWERIIFCGSVVSDDYRLDKVLGRFKQPLLNEVGTLDYLPALAESATWGYGSVGSSGYNAIGVETRWHHGLRHSDFLTKEFCDKFWVPFLSKGKIIDADPSTDLPLWIRLITGFPLRYLQPVMALAAMAGMILAVSLYAKDPAAKASETKTTRVNSFTLHLPSESFEPGNRFWTRPTTDRWVERYTSGFSTAFAATGRTSSDACDGTIVASQREPTLELFIPDKGCEQMILKFRRRSPKWFARVTRSDLKWNNLSLMQEVQ